MKAWQRSDLRRRYPNAARSYEAIEGFGWAAIIVLVLALWALWEVW